MNYAETILLSDEIFEKWSTSFKRIFNQKSVFTLQKTCVSKKTNYSCESNMICKTAQVIYVNNVKSWTKCAYNCSITCLKVLILQFVINWKFKLPVLHLHEIFYKKIQKYFLTNLIEWYNLVNMDLQYHCLMNKWNEK